MLVSSIMYSSVAVWLIDLRYVISPEISSYIICPVPLISSSSANVQSLVIFNTPLLFILPFNWLVMIVRLPVFSKVLSSAESIIVRLPIFFLLSVNVRSLRV